MTRSHSRPSALLCAAVVLAALAPARAAWAVCDTANFQNPENDCDNDGQTVGQGDCLDCDIDGLFANIPDCGVDPHPGTQDFADPRTVQLGAAEICDGFDNNCNAQADEGFDVDGDGFTSCGGDCNDGDGTIHPGATEQCDGVDQDCDGVPDQNENITRACYDGPGGTNGVGVCHGGTQTCTGATFGACNGEVVPSAEVCNGLDDDCKNGADDGLIVDVDGDGARACGSCGAPAAPNCDCNDGNGAVHPGATEHCDGVDEDCDGVLDQNENITRQCYDNFLPAGGTAGVGACSFGTQSCTGASFGTCTGDGTGASDTESCNNIDDNCNGSTDEGLIVDVDGDGSRACGTCGAPAAPNCDCNDGDGAVHPGRGEVCNGVDDNCNGLTDERNAAGDPLQQSCYDGPGGTRNVGVCRGGQQQCLGGAFAGNPCNGEVLPSAEICDGLDNDCVNGADDGLITDVDGDGVPACTSACLLPPFSASNCDCDDGDPNNAPGRNEVCDGQDNNCNGVIDEGFDNDGDGFLSCAFCSTSPCDCNDNDNTIFPNAPEDCGPVDKDCDGIRFPAGTDLDGDGVPGQTPCNQDCNDDPNAFGQFQHPAYGPIAALTDVCDGLDNDCNGTVDHAANGNIISRSCYDGPGGTAGVGTCRAGTQTCNAVPGSHVSSFSACTGEVLPSNDPALPETTCNGADDDCDTKVDDGFDEDVDGFTTCNGDCNDNDATVHPNATELCDAIDQNCNGNLTDVPPVVCFDGQNVTPDTFTGVCPGPGCTPNPPCHAGVQTCLPDGTLSACGGDLVLPANDPAGPEAQCNQIDDDCDGVVDDGDFDQDGDGFKVCDGDCNDNNADIHPGALEICDDVDNDCDGNIDGDQTQCYSGPPDTVGVGLCVAGTSQCVAGVPSGDCAGEVVPAAEECDLLDNDCDGLVDEDFDNDGDGFPDCALCPSLTPAQCDCDDNDPFNNPGATEVCDCQDNNCDGNTDEGGVCTGAPCHDFDGDGVTNCQGDCNDRNPAVGPNRPEIFGNGIDDDCDGQVDEDTDEDGDGYTTSQGDCDDRFAEINPGAVEVCDGFDNNCDGNVDEGFDQDGDGARTCTGDCDDNNPAVSPFRAEICGNGIDDNCDGQIDEDTDNDGDGVTTCEGDCNDYNAAVHPAFGDIEAAPEVCDGQSNDCSGPPDEGFDQDGDGVPTCFGDCNDSDPNISPLLLEIPGNGVDDNCDGQIDEVDRDDDGDGFTGACGDCNDANASVNPHAAELCDRIDNNCDALVDALPDNPALCSVCFDNDGDGFTNCDGDCDDTDPEVFPGAVEICNQKDDDCDRRVDLSADGLRVCGGDDDAGVPDDAGAPDAGAADADAGPVAQGPAPLSPVTVGCTCGLAGPASPGDAAASMLPFAALFALLALWRRGPRAPRRALIVAPAAWDNPVARAKGASLPVALAVIAGFGACQCDGVRVPKGVDLTPAAEGEGDGGEGEGEGEGEGNPSCVPDPAVAVETLDVPGARTPFALPRHVDATFLANTAGIALDSDADVEAVVLTRPLPPGVDATDAGAADVILSDDSSALDALPGSPVVSSRVQLSERSFLTREDQLPSAQALYRVQLAGPTTAAQVRNRAAQALADAAPGALNDLPAPRQTSLFTSEMQMAVFVRVVDDVSVTVIAFTPQELGTQNGPLLGDLTNGTHVGPPGAILDVNCEEKQFPVLKSDFVFVVDNSGSMQEEQQGLANAADEFYAALVNSGLDARLGVVTTDSDVLRGAGFTNDPSVFRQDVQVGIDGNGLEMGLEFAARAVTLADDNADDARRFRDDAAKVVIIISDEEASDLRTIPEYVDFFTSEGAIVYAIVGPRPVGCVFVGLGAAQLGEHYIEVAQATGGSSASICNPNLAETIADILVGAAGAASRSPLERTPISSSLHVDVEGAPVDRSRTDGFDYEATSNTVLFFGSRPPEGTPVEISYQFFNVVENG